MAKSVKLFRRIAKSARRMATLLSLMATAILVALCVRSWPLGLSDTLYIHLPKHCVRLEMEPYGGRVIVACFATISSDAGRPIVELSTIELLTMHESGYQRDDVLEWSSGGWQLLGFAVGTGTRTAGAKLVFAFPFWFVMGCAVTPMMLIWLTGTRNPRQPRVSRVCRKCGYDMRATPHRCPECGTVPPSARLTTAS